MSSQWIFLINVPMTRSRCQLHLSLDNYHHLHSQERQSTETRIVLKSVKLTSEGSYLCEVSGEAPLFQTAKNQNFLKVVGNEDWHAGVIITLHDDHIVADLPDQGPVISGSLPRYKVGDVISANCSSLHSIPAARLNWSVSHIIKWLFISEIIKCYC